jgi:antitoxin component YwqK of YwqJK toxin-antitoxin module
MHFKIESGQNICSVGLAECGSYFRFNKPLAVVNEHGYNHGSSLLHLFCNLKYDQEYRNTVNQKIIDNLNVDYTGKLDKLYDILSPIFPIFKNGDYQLSFHFKEGERALFSCYGNNKRYIYQEICFSDYLNCDQSPREQEDKHEENLSIYKVKDYNAFDIKPHFVSTLYQQEESFYATQPLDSIDIERVKYFENLIRKGERPFAILVNAHRGECQSAYYIIDGHHKLLAYRNLKINPPVALLTYIPKFDGPGAINEDEFDIELLAESLYPWHTRDILISYGYQRPYLKKFLSNPNSPLHQLIRNGSIEEYYDNGQLRHRAFYENETIRGKSENWYQNGMLKSVQYYCPYVKNKRYSKKCGIWRDFYESGNLQKVVYYNDIGENDGPSNQFFDNGRMKTEEIFVKGKHKDGISSRTWSKSGVLLYENTFQNGILIVLKSWNNDSKLIKHQVRNLETNQFEKVKIHKDADPLIKEETKPIEETNEVNEKSRDAYAAFTKYHINRIDELANLTKSNYWTKFRKWWS